MNFDDLKYNDRGIKKWTSFMLPEHVDLLREFDDKEYYKTSKPMLDPYQKQELEEKIHYAMEYHYSVTIETWVGGLTEQIHGRIHDLDPFQKDVRVQDDEGHVERVKFESIIDVEVEDI
jgi:hypothetical protein